MNNKIPYKDGLIFLALLVFVSLGGGIALIITAPSFWIIQSSTTMVVGILFLMIGAMYLPGLIYRLLAVNKNI